MVAYDLAAQDIAQRMAQRKGSDVDAAMKTLIDINRSGDVNGVRVQAATALLRVHGQLDPVGIRATAKSPDGGKLVVEVVHVEKPVADDDD